MLNSYIAIMPLLLFISCSLLLNRVSLDAILIPCAKNEMLTRKRANKAAEELPHNPNAVIIVSGGKTPGLNPKYENEAQVAYETLEKAGVNPQSIQIEHRAKDTFGNIRLSLKHLPPNAKKIGVISNRGQLNRIEQIVERGKIEGVIPDNVKIFRIEIPATFSEKLHEIIASIKTSHRLKNTGFSEDMPESQIKKFIKKIRHWFNPQNP